MSLVPLLLVLTAALLHAAWNVAAKHAGGNRHFVLLTALMVVVIWGPAGVYVGWPVVKSWSWLAWGMVLASGVAHLLYFRCLLRGYRESDLTVVYPVARGSGPLLTTLAATVVLKEHVTVFSAAGVLAICGGIFLIAGGPALLRRSLDETARRRARSGILWGAATGSLIALYTVIDGYAVKVLILSPILVDYLGNVLRLPFMLPEAAHDLPGLRAAFRTQWRHVLIVAAISPLSYILVLFAARLAPLSHVAPAREISMLFVALLGGRLLGEGDRGKRLIGAACMAAGVVLLAIS